MTWEIIKKAFIDWFYSREMREEKVVEFINLRQGRRSVHKYSFKFIKVSKYTPSIVFSPRNQMINFVTGVMEDLQKKCHSPMVHDNMNIFLLMVHTRRFEEARSKLKSRDVNRARSFDGGATRNRLDIQDKSRFKKGSLIKFHQNFLRLMIIRFLSL